MIEQALQEGGGSTTNDKVSPNKKRAKTARQVEGDDQESPKSNEKPKKSVTKKQTTENLKKR